MRVGYNGRQLLCKPDRALEEKERLTYTAEERLLLAVGLQVPAGLYELLDVR